MATKQPSKLSTIPRSIRAVVRRWEAAAGYEILRGEQIKDRRTLREVLQFNQHWLEEHLEEKLRQAGRVVSSV